MKFEQLGVITFFGILIPGAYLTAFLILTFACILELNGIHGHTEVFSFLSKNSLLSTSVFIFISYLFGIIVRLFAVRVVDRASTRYLSGIRRQKAKWVYDVFPYQETLTLRLNDLGMSQVTHLITGLNKKYGEENNTSFFNYCQLIAEANNETIAKHIQQNEALVRFLAGTAFALTTSCILGLCFFFIFLFKSQILFFQLYATLTLVSLIALAGILERFKYQRRREIVTVWCSIYLLLNGGIPNALGISPDELAKRVTLEIDPDSIHHGSSDDDQTVE